MFEFYYQVNASMMPSSMDIHVDGTVTGKTAAECVDLVHQTGKEQMYLALLNKFPTDIIDKGTIQTKMTMFVQVFERPEWYTHEPK